MKDLSVVFPSRSVKPRRCGKPVEDPLNRCGRVTNADFFSFVLRGKPFACTVWVRLRWSFRLWRRAESLECSLVFTILLPIFYCPGRTVVNVHRFEEIINGREYRIEVSSVDGNMWRAQIARTPGGSAALMPFYGRTPDEAAQHLSRWLSIAHGQPQTRL
jgi:hypothetical protein